MASKEGIAPLFITFEGGEGAGKTTLIGRLEKKLMDRGYLIVKTREPGGSRLGNAIRGFLLNRDAEMQVGAKAELLLFLAARAQHIEELIAPALAAGKIVLCDRFNDSTIAYQGYARGLGVDYVSQMCNFACAGVTPALTLFLDVDPELGLKRSMRIAKENAVAGQADRIEAERVEFHQRVRHAFQEMAQKEPTRFRRIDASQSIDLVTAQALKYVEEVLV